MISYKQKLHPINTFIFDIDGVLTNGMVLLHNGEVIRNLNSKDSYAMQHATKMGYKIFIITGGNSEEMKMRLEKLGVTEVVLNSNNKVKAFENLIEKYQISYNTSLYMGDDIPDIRLLEKVHVSACPLDAVPEVKNVVDYISPLNGGSLCVRDVIEQTMKLQGKWMTEEAHEW